jgi:hypothetical protein
LSEDPPETVLFDGEYDTWVGGSWNGRHVDSFFAWTCWPT